MIHPVYFLHPDRERTETYRIKSDEKERKSENRWPGVGQRENGVKKKGKADADELLKGTFDRTPWPGVFIKILSIF